jgi:16S rRNA processing protein RimM
VRVVVGRLTGVFGIRGELKCRPTELGRDAFVAGETFACGAEPGARTLRCRSARRHHERLLVAFEGIETPEAARELAGIDLYAEREIALEADEYLDADLIGLRMLDEAGRELGRISGVEHFPAQDCVIVEPGRGLVPLVKAYVRRIDLHAGTIVVDLPEGML